MAGFATFSSVEDAIKAGNYQTVSWYQTGTSGTGAGPFVSYWLTSTRPAAGTAPAGTPGVAYSNEGINFGNTGSIRKFLYQITAESAQTNESHLMLVDRLVGVGGIAVSTTGDKTVNSTALTRYTTGESVQVFLEVSTAGTTTAPIVSLSSYTNSDGTPGRAGATLTFPTTTYAAGGLIGPMPLQTGDYGIKSVETLNVATAGGGSGVISVILVKPLSEVVVDGGRSGNGEKEWLLPNTHFIRIFDGASLMWIMQNSQNNATAYHGSITVIEG